MIFQLSLIAGTWLAAFTVCSLIDRKRRGQNATFPTRFVAWSSFIGALWFLAAVWRLL